MDTTPALATVPKPAKRVISQRPLRAATIIGSFVALLYLVELADLTVFHGELNNHGIIPRRLSGLDGVLWAPLLHESWQHILGNTVPVLVFGFLAMAGGLRQWIAATVLIWLVSGIGVWLIGPSDVSTIGASGVAFGWLAFLLVRGLFNRSAGQLMVALVLLFYWGSLLLGLLPGAPTISWQGHLFGAIGGILAAWLAARATPRKTDKPLPPAAPGNLAA